MSMFTGHFVMFAMTVEQGLPKIIFLGLLQLDSGKNKIFFKFWLRDILTTFVKFRFVQVYGLRQWWNK